MSFCWLRNEPLIKVPLPVTATRETNEQYLSGTFKNMFSCYVRQVAIILPPPKVSAGWGPDH